MLDFTLRRTLYAIPTLLIISFIIFAILDLAPNDPTATLPLTIPPEVREKFRVTLGLNQPFHIRYILWLKQFFIAEPLNLLEKWIGVSVGDSEHRLRIQSWTTRSAVVDLIAERLPQTLLVVGVSYLIGIVIAIPIGVLSACKKNSVFDRLCTLVTMIGFSMPTFFTGLLLIILFSITLGWLPSVYDTTHRVVDLPSLWFQIKQMAMPVLVLALFNAALLSRFLRASMLDNLQQDYVRTARAKGMTERAVVLAHVLPNSLLPLVTIVALGVPQIFAGALITEQIFHIPGLGQLMITAIHSGDVPLAQTLAFVFAVLVVMCNLAADIVYGLLDPRIRYE